MPSIEMPIKPRIVSMSSSSFKTIIIFIQVAIVIQVSTAQIISHELRRLASATNQFGIDSLKALDKLEPPDKVLVFCPVCLSSSLMMIMMGSSKFAVVSSLRHALYVWSMKPADINKGFKDVLDHIGINQAQQDRRGSHQSTVTFANSITRSATVGHSDQSVHRIKRSPYETIATISQHGSQLSLPKLIKAKEFLDRSSSSLPARAWWHSMSRRSDHREQVAPEFGKQSRNDSYIQSHSNRHEQRVDMGDMSQMNALSNIYIQRGLTMNHNYNLLLRQYYKTVIHPVDFIRNTEETRQHINSLVATNTEGKIKDLVKKNLFETRVTTPKIMLISTFHFRGTLDLEMKVKDKNLSRTRRHSGYQNSTSLDNIITTNQQHAKSKGPAFIETEPTLLKYGHFRDLDCSVVEIPFNNRLITLVIVMPNNHNSTEILLTKLNGQVLNDLISSLVVKKLSIEIPVIKFDRGPVNMKGLLRELGLDSIFFGDQPYSSETGLNRWMRPSDVVHETSIDIGTINPNWSHTEDRLKVGAHDSRTSESNHIKLDKPFFYFVFDSINSLILTMGRIRQ